jgi:hypothetical protein
LLGRDLHPLENYFRISCSIAFCIPFGPALPGRTDGHAARPRRPSLRRRVAIARRAPASSWLTSRRRHPHRARTADDRTCLMLEGRERPGWRPHRHPHNHRRRLRAAPARNSLPSAFVAFRRGFCVRIAAREATFAAPAEGESACLDEVRQRPSTPRPTSEALQRPSTPCRTGVPVDDAGEQPIETMRARPNRPPS